MNIDMAGARPALGGALAAMLALVAIGCSEPAKENLREVGRSLGEAGESLDAAIRRGARDVEPKAKEAGEEVVESLSDVRAKLQRTGEAVDDVADHVVEEVADDSGEDDDEPRLDPDAVVCADERYTVTREVASEVADSPMQLALEAGVQQTDRGAKVTEVEPGGILARLGVREGDVIVGISGLDLEGPMDRPLSERLKSDHVTIAVERDGRRIDKVLSIAEDSAPTSAPGS